MANNTMGDFRRFRMTHGVVKMSLMTKERKERKPVGRPAKGDDRPAGISRTFRFDPALLAALDRFIRSQRYKTTRTDVLEVALQELLKAEGFWPPDTPGH